jgi:hypothetical protein
MTKKGCPGDKRVENKKATCCSYMFFFTKGNKMECQKNKTVYSV